MSSREPLWYCYECHAEMRPLMVPDPHCASCNGTFVEKLENPLDDPREFSGAAGDFEDPFSGGDALFSGLQNLMRAMGPTPTNGPRSPPGGATRGSPSFGGGNGFTIRIDRTSAPGGEPRTTFSTSSGPLRSDRSGEIPTLSDFVSQNRRGGAAGQDHDTINGPLMFQYLMAMLQQPGSRGPVADLFGGLVPPGAESGRMGDYVFNQEALDQIITQMMENSSAHPVPASEEVITKLPREVLEENSPLLEKDCAVCKEQFQLGTEDPDEQVVVSLPCKHPFHEPCIMPWLKSSGTCPVCRFQLVPQPEHHAPGTGPPSGSSGGSNGSRSPGSPGSANGPRVGPGLIGSLVNMLSSAGSGSASGSNPGSNNRTSNGPDSSTRTSHDEHDIPGGWNEVD